MTSTDANYDYIFKIVIVGDANVGKTCLLVRYADDVFKEEYKITIGVDFKIRSIFMDGKRVKLNIWDTAGAERFRTMLCNYYRGAHGVILVYDVTDRESFASLQSWLDDVNRNTSRDINKILVGNKCDLASKRCVDFNAAKALANRFEMSYIETSAKDSTNVDEAFLMMAADIVERMGPPKMSEQPDSIILGKGVPVQQDGYFYCC